jgi:adenylate cyclase
LLHPVAAYSNPFSLDKNRRRLLLRKTFGNSRWKSENIFEERFQREITKTELLRVKILVLSLVIVFFIALLNLYLNSSDKAIALLRLNLGSVALFVSLVIAYEVFIAMMLRRRVRKRLPVSLALQVVNIFVETSIPTAFSLMLFHRSHDMLVLFTPILSVYFLFIVLSTLHLSFWMSVGTGLLAFVEYYSASLYIMRHLPGENLSPVIVSSVLLFGRSILLLLCGFAAGFVSLEIRRRLNATFEALNAQSKIREVLGQQVSHALVDRIMNEGTMHENERRMVCIMFLDIRDFTPFVSGKQPEEIVDYQNKLFGIAIESVSRYNGIINQFLGDGFMATFGAPVSGGNDCKNGVDAALEILNETAKAAAEQLIPATRLGIGIHYGEAVTGNIGTSVRRQYSIVGNVVIQASRIEQLNKEFHSQLLISKEVYNRSEIQEGKSLGALMLKGESEPLEIMQIV